MAITPYLKLSLLETLLVWSDLAWIRTGLAIMGFGFVVARFSLFLRVMAAQRTDSTTPVAAPIHFSNAVGIALVVLGVATMLVAAIQHRAFVAALPPSDLPSSHHRVFPVLVALGLAVLGLILAVSLALEAVVVCQDLCSEASPTRRRHA